MKRRLISRLSPYFESLGARFVAFVTVLLGENKETWMEAEEERTEEFEREMYS